MREDVQKPFSIQEPFAFSNQTDRNVLREQLLSYFENQLCILKENLESFLVSWVR
ncbi:hypothetical protein FH581_024455 [Leptospira weilii]|nr:hypothetical protein FH586_11370 [Leptospira weilii]UPY78010.1 hypothetical protein FH581_024455 [Leptospira weilii]